MKLHIRKAQCEPEAMFSVKAVRIPLLPRFENLARQQFCMGWTTNEAISPFSNQHLGF